MKTTLWHRIIQRRVRQTRPSEDPKTWGLSVTKEGRTIIIQSENFRGPYGIHMGKGKEKTI